MLSQYSKSKESSSLDDRFFFSVLRSYRVTVSDAGLLGAALVYVMQLGGLFQWAVRQSAEVRLSAFSLRSQNKIQNKTAPVELLVRYIH